MISRAAIEKHSRRCADELVEVVEAATRLAKRTGNTFALDRQRVAGLIAGHFSAALAAEGMTLVPVEPTEVMLGAGRGHAVPSTQSIGAIYRAMLKAAGASDADK